MTSCSASASPLGSLQSSPLASPRSSFGSAYSATLSDLTSIGNGGGGAGGGPACSALLRKSISRALERHFCDVYPRKILHWAFVDIDKDDPDWISRAECACCAATHVVEVLFHDLVHNTFIVHRYGLNVAHSGKAVHVTADQFADSEHPYCDAKRLDNFFYDRFCESLSEKKSVCRQPAAQSESIPISNLSKSGTLQRRGTFSRLMRRNSGQKREACAPSAGVLPASPPPRICDSSGSVSPPCGAPVFFGASCRHLALKNSSPSNSEAKRNGNATCNGNATYNSNGNAMYNGNAGNATLADLTEFFDRLTTPPLSSRQGLRNNS